MEDFEILNKLGKSIPLVIYRMLIKKEMELTAVSIRSKE